MHSGRDISTKLNYSRPIEKLVPRYHYLKAIKVLDDFIGPFIDRTLALDNYELDKLSKSEKSFTFLHALAGYTRDPKVIRDQLMVTSLTPFCTYTSWDLY